MKTRFNLMLALVCAIALTPSPCRATVAPSITLSITYADKLDGLGDGGYITSETGIVQISIPLSGVNIATFETNTTAEVIAMDSQSVGFDWLHALGDDPTYKPGKKTATFVELDPLLGNPIGKTIWTWTSTTLTINGSYKDTNDVFGAEMAFGITPDTNETTEITDTFTATVNFDVFSYSRGVPVTGKNTSRAIVDSGGNPVTLNSGSISGAADFTPPKVAVTKPLNNATVTNPVVTLAGRATDNAGVASIFIVVNNDFSAPPAVEIDLNPSQLATNWSTTVDLSMFGGNPGSNNFGIYAVDTSTNYSTTNVVNVFWALPETLLLQTNPPKSGTITGLKNNQTVDIAKGYPVTATAKSGFAFVSWTDGRSNLLSQSPSFDYEPTNASDMTLVANFAPNPYTVLKGTYDGLFYDPVNGATPTNAGHITITVTTTGAYSGKLYFGSSTTPYPFTGQFILAPDFARGDTSNTFGTFKIKRVALAPLIGTLQLNSDTNMTDPGAGWIGGAINPADDSWATNAVVSAVLGHYIENSNNAPGIYNFFLPPLENTGAGDTGPGGYSFGAATLASKTGAVTFSLNLADGISTPISFATTIGPDGSVPLYSSLYSGKGLFLGWLIFTNDTSSAPEKDFESTWLAWAKLPTASKFYAAGFSTVTNPVSLTGSIYVAPKKGTNIVGWTNGTMTATGGNLAKEVNATLAYNPAKNTVTGTNAAFAGGKVTLTLTTTSGALSGTFVPAPAKTAISFKGLLLTNTQSGYGFFTGTNQTGAVLIAP